MYYRRALPMQIETPLSKTLCDVIQDLGRPAPFDGPGLETRLVGMVQDAQRSWPKIGMNVEAFVRYIVQSLPSEQSVSEGIEVVNISDLFLAYGCSCHHPAAIAAFEAHFLGKVPSYVARIDSEISFGEEVSQHMRQWLFGFRCGGFDNQTGGLAKSLAESRNGSRPGIADYQGRGSLAGWLRVVAIRTALNLKRSARRATKREMDARMLIPIEAVLTPDLAYMREHYRQPFKDALISAISELSDRDRALLRLYYGNGLVLQALASLYQVHSSTVSRWLACAREQVAKRTIRFLCGELEVGTHDAANIAAVAMSAFDTSLFRYFRAE